MLGVGAPPPPLRIGVVVRCDEAHTSISSSRPFLNLRRRRRRFRRSSRLVIHCKNHNTSPDAGHDFVLASLLISETARHHHMRLHGFEEEIKRQSSSKLPLFSIQGMGEPRTGSNFIGPGFLQRFQSPTIFLKISCDEDFLLPIVVGEFAVQKLIESSQEDDNGDYPNHFQLVRHVVGKLGYEVRMIKITERVVNTYFAGIFFQKPGKSEIFQVDARPSDAINVAQRCKVPIYVNKQIVLNDAIKIDYGGRIRDTKSIYDVTLDSAAEGPDLLLEELEMVKNMNLAVKLERYSEAAMWRDKLMKHRDSRNEH